MLKVRIDHSVWKSFPADSDTFKHAVTSQLMHDQLRVDFSGLFVGVRHHATDEVGFGGVQGGHQVSQLLLIEAGNRFSAAFLLLSSPSSAVIVKVSLPWMVLEDLVDQSAVLTTNN